LTKFLGNNSFIYKDKKILDLGSGSGVQGIVCALNGAKEVVMSDIEESAIKNIKRNVEILNLDKKTKIIKSDLFSKLGKIKFDIIIFNHPFFPDKSFSPVSRVIFSGPELLDKFFKDVSRHIDKRGLIIMPFSHFAPFYNDPINFIAKYKYSYLVQEVSNEYGRHSIYIMSKNKELIRAIQRRTS